MNRDIRIYFLFIGLPAVVLTVVGLLTLVFGVSGLAEEMRAPDHAKQLERYERKVKSRMASRAKAYVKDGKADFVWVANSVPWDASLFKRAKYGCYGATNQTAIGWARLEDGRVIGFRMPPFKYEDRRGLYLIGIGTVMVVLLCFTLFAGGWLLARAARRAREELETKNTFLDVISHELNTPLGSIVPLSSALAAGGIRNEGHRQEALATISRESARMARMINELLTVVRLRNGKIRFERERFDLGEAVAAAADLVRIRYRDCAIRVAGEGEPVAVADRDKTEQVVINLIENACRYAGDETIEVGYQADGRRRVQITVADRGAGIPETERSRLFERFYQMAPDDPENGGCGLGLGLNIVAGSVRGMGGMVAVSERPGGGSVFTVELPGDDVPEKGKMDNG